LFVFVRLVMPDGAAGSRSQESMVPGHMTGNATNDRAFEATFGVSGDGSNRQGQC
jgi:hypothetical protein